MIGAILGSIAGRGVVSAAEGVANVIDRFIETDDEKRVSEAEKRAAELLKTKILMKPRLAQIELSKVEAAHRNPFVAGGRPFILWTCGVSIAFYFIPQFALGAWLWTRQVIMTGELVPYPVAADGLMELTLGMLGLGAMRTVEKLGGRTK